MDALELFVSHIVKWIQSLFIYFFFIFINDTISIIILLGFYKYKYNNTTTTYTYKYMQDPNTENNSKKYNIECRI